jgi:hypothetical protein
MPKKVLMEVFRAGSQTDSSGHTKEWTEKDLDTIVDKFNELGDDIPATIGHPESDTAPAFGWFKKVIRKGDTLLAELSDVVEEFGEMLKKKMFKNRSIALRPDLSLRHIAFLGAAAPAVKGLEDFAFKAKDDFTLYEFEEAQEEKTILEKIKLLFKELSEKKNFKQPEDDMSKELEEKIANLEKESTETKNAFAEFKKDAEAKEAKFAEDLKTEKKRADEAEAKIATSLKDAKKKEFSDWFDGQVEEGNEIPANKSMVLAQMEALDGQEALTFGEGDGAKKVTQLEAFKKRISSGAKQISFGEEFGKGQGPKSSGDQLSDAAKKIMNDNKGMSFSESLKRAQDENPELVKLYDQGK